MSHQCLGASPRASITVPCCLHTPLPPPRLAAPQKSPPACALPWGAGAMLVLGYKHIGATKADWAHCKVARGGRMVRCAMGVTACQLRGCCPGTWHVPVSPGGCGGIQPERSLHMPQQGN